MELVYGALEVTGDFTLRNIKELGYDRDFVLLPPGQVIRLKTDGFSIQFVSVARILLRASLLVPEVTCHFLTDTDLASAAANFTFRGDQHRLEIRLDGTEAVLSLIPKSENGPTK